MSKLATISSSLSRFVALLSSLPLELLGYVLVEGGLEIYRSALLKHVLVNEVTGVISRQADQDNRPRVARIGLEFFGNQYAVSDTHLDKVEDLGVDHLGRHRFPKGSLWYMQREDAELICQVRLFSPKNPVLSDFLSTHFCGLL
jgi:hypothetical protein